MKIGPRKNDDLNQTIRCVFDAPVAYSSRVRCNSILDFDKVSDYSRPMTTLRMTSDLRRELILGAAKRCFARNGFAGTTTKSVAAAAAISEALLFKHFPPRPRSMPKFWLKPVRPIRRAPCSARSLQPRRSSYWSGAWSAFLEVSASSDQQEAQRLRLMVSSQLDDGEFARLLYEKIRDLIGRAFTASLERAIAAGDAVPVGREPLNLFWFAHHTVLMMVLTKLPSVPTLSYGSGPDLERQICEFILEARSECSGNCLASGPGTVIQRRPNVGRRKCMT